MSDIPAWLSAFFEDEDPVLLGILRPLIERAAKSGAVFSAQQLGVTDWRLINETAMHWAEGHSGQLITQISETQKQAVAEKVADYIGTPGANLADLMARIRETGIDSTARANLIAQTEITDAYAQGNRIAFKQAGIEKRRHNTNNDSLVCPDCAPLNGRIFALDEDLGDDEIPVHPGCRCWYTPVVEGHEDRG